MGEGTEGSGHLVAEAAEAGDRESHEVPITSRGSLIRSWAILVASLAGLATAIGAWVKPQDHTVAQQSYEELAKRLDAVADQQQKTHDDLVAMRTYMAQKSGEVFVLPSQSTQTTEGTVLRPLVRTSPSASSPLVPAASVKPPDIQPFVRAEPPPSFDHVLQRAKK